MIDAQWYAKIDGVETGPYSPAAFKVPVQGEKIGPETPVKREGTSRFVAASLVEGPISKESEPSS